MPEVAVNATATNTTPAEAHETTEAAPKVKPAVGAKKAVKAAPPKFESKIEEVLWRVNEPTSDEVEDTKSMSDIIDGAVENASKPSKEATPEPQTHADGEPETTPGKEKFVVNGKEYELTPDQAKRFVQKGILHELKNRETANKARELQAKEAEASKLLEEQQAVLKALKDNALDVLVEMHGEDGVRGMLESWLRPRIEREMLPAEQQREIAWKERAEKAEKMLQAEQEAKKQAQIEQESAKHLEHFQKVIVTALDQKGIPKTAFAAKEMAEWIQRGLSNNIEYTPEQLADFVREDNLVRVGSLTGHYVTQIQEAQKAGKSEEVIKYGEELSELLGEPVMVAIGKYYLAKAKAGQPKVTPQVLDTPKMKPQESKRSSGYMTEDEYAAKRKERISLMQQGIDPGEW